MYLLFASNFTIICLKSFRNSRLSCWKFTLHMCMFSMLLWTFIFQIWLVCRLSRFPLAQTQWNCRYMTVGTVSLIKVRWTYFGHLCKLNIEECYSFNPWGLCETWRQRWGDLDKRNTLELRVSKWHLQRSSTIVGNEEFPPPPPTAQICWWWTQCVTPCIVSASVHPSTI